ncbi:MAG: hypothetical protein N3B16_08125 [Candidatus Aminicenantes bacterium]|nr:hypothetical protein [Candidatus Aminicenantes bacterium]
MAFYQGVKILFCQFGLASNKKEILPIWPGKIDVPSLLTDFHEILANDWPKGLADAYIFILDSKNLKPRYVNQGNYWYFEGPFLELAKQTSDRRFTFWGNQGFLYRLTLSSLEKNHHVYSFHACGLVDESGKKLIVVAGGAGSGKTVYLLSGLRLGYKLFSTETVHFRLVGNEVEWFMGSLVDNIRLGTLRHHFPEFLPSEFENNLGWTKEWQQKVAIDLSAYKFTSTTLRSPECWLIFPHIEEGWESYQLNEISDQRVAARILFNNITEKIANSFILYDALALTGFDSPTMALSRLEILIKLLSHSKTRNPIEILANPKECWRPILESRIGQEL